MNVFITGGTGYIGSRLIPELLARGHTVRALVRAGSEGKLAKGAVAVPGNALDRATFAGQVAPSDTFIQLGTPCVINACRKTSSSPAAAATSAAG